MENKWEKVYFDNIPMKIKDVKIDFGINDKKLKELQDIMDKASHNFYTNYYTYSDFYPFVGTWPAFSKKEPEKKGTALVFGANGQSGSYLCEHLLDKNYDVVAVIRRSSVHNTERIDHLKDKIKIVEGDVTDPHSIHNLITEHKPVHIYNLAAQSHVGTSFKQPIQTWESTATGCLNILNAIVNIDKTIRFYQASTSEMFGKNYSEEMAQTNWSTDFDANGNTVEKVENTIRRYQDEETEFMPQSPYAIAKLAAHHMVRLYRDSYGIFASSGILFNHGSPRRGENFVTRKITKYLGRLLKWLNENGENKIDVDDLGKVWAGDMPFSSDLLKRAKEAVGPLELGNLDAKRDWGHASCYTKCMILMLEHDKPDDFVVATGETHSVRELLELAFSSVWLDYNDFVEINPEFYRPAEVDYLRGSPTKAKEILGWQNEYSFEDLVLEMVKSDYAKA